MNAQNKICICFAMKLFFIKCYVTCCECKIELKDKISCWLLQIFFCPGSAYFCLSLYFKKIVYLFDFGCAESSLLCKLFSSCGNWGDYSLVVVHRLLTSVGSLFLEHGL